MGNGNTEMTIQAKAINLFKYLQAMQEKQDSIVFNYQKHQWSYFIKDLPDDPENIDFHYCDYVKYDDYSALEDIPYILKVHNPDFDACPMPSNRLMPWLQEDWNDFHVEKPKIRERIPVLGSKPVMYQEFRLVFDSQVMYDRWLEKRNIWRERQLLLEKTRNLFAELFTHRQSLIKDDGELELLIANGVFQVAEDSSISHPVLLKRVEIEFDTKHNDIYVKDVDVNSNFYIELFNGISDISRVEIQKADAENSRKQYYPFDRNEAKAFFERLIHAVSPRGKIFPDMDTARLSDAAFKISWEPMLILRQRPSGMAKMINKIIEKIEATENVPQHLIDILQPENNFVEADDYTAENMEAKLAAVGGEAIDILLPKEANQEQLDIARTIDKNHAVVVQGPPGTGKTHTIANLLGHFLSQGKRVLVTSHTNKALKVLKDKVEAELQPLCVSVTDDSRRDIESSIAEIANFSETPAKLERDIRECKAKRKYIIEQLNETRKKLFQIRNQQCNTITLNGEAFSPINAAKFLKDNRDRLADIIPGNVYACEALPVSYEALVDLYDSNQSVSVDDEQQLACNLPSVEDIWLMGDFAKVVERYNYNKNIVDALENQNKWKFIAEDATTNFLAVDGVKIPFDQGLQEKLLNARAAVDEIRNYEEWELRIIADGTNSIHNDSWHKLVAAINAAYEQYSKYQRLSFGKEITFSSFEEVKQHVQDYEKLVQSDGKIGFVQGLLNGSLKKAKQSVLINDAEIASGKDAELVLEYIAFKKLETTCKIAWRSLFGNGAIAYSNIEQAHKYAKSVSGLLSWQNGAYSSVLYKINACGIAVDKLCPNNELITEFENLRASLAFSKNVVPQLVDGMLAFMEMRSQEKLLEKYYQQMSGGLLTTSAACINTARAIKNKDIEGYKKASDTLRVLSGKYTLQRQRFETLEKIAKYAPAWANAIKNRQGIHGSFNVPENISDAWKWKQLERILDEINDCDYSSLQKNAISLAKDYHKATADLAAAKAWYELQKRNSQNGAMQSALRGWVQLVRKLGKGTGKYAEFYRQEIRKQMTKCQDAVPVWIMPVRKVLETFDPVAMQVPFDIVIVDEASQSDLTSLAVTFLGKKVIIVGDDKQVSPLAVGTDLAPIQDLADLYISSWIPNPQLYTPKDSLYSIGFVSYKSRMLLEHFRCVPEIIGYSNWLSYDNKIKPLREASSSNLLPAVVNYRVDGHRDGKRKINQVEAQTIVALIQSCLEQPEYNGKTFGVISLLGKDQAEYIQRELFNTIGNIAYEQRQIICGDSANFQGDERDVIFLSMVDSNEGDGVLRLLNTDANGDAYKKRYNVAASRAKDQLWVINSLDEENSLQASDLRRGLLSYAKNPQDYRQTIIQIEEQSESPFEEEVAKGLVSKGFHIVQQWEVGAYRIDMVAVYKNHKIAIECDGERYHSGEDKILEDMQRQTILERLGWKFIRIRGSEYFTDPGNTLNRVAALLLSYGIEHEDNFTSTPVNRETKLLQCVKQRAAEIMRGEEPPKPEPPTPTTEYLQKTKEAIEEIYKYGNQTKKVAETVAVKAKTLLHKANSEKAKLEEVSRDAKNVVAEIEGLLKSVTERNRESEFRIASAKVKEITNAVGIKVKRIAEEERCLDAQVNVVSKAALDIDKVYDDTKDFVDKMNLAVEEKNIDECERLFKDINAAVEIAKKTALYANNAQAELENKNLKFDKFICENRGFIDDAKRDIASAKDVIKRKGINIHLNPIKELELLLDRKNVKYKDNRYKGEGFCLIGGSELSNVVLKAAELGFIFRFHEKDNAWYLEGKKTIKKESDINPKTKKDTIITILEKRGVEYIDKRQENGALWIIGGAELKDIVDIAKTIGVYFRFKPEGGRISKHKPAWWAK